MHAITLLVALSLASAAQAETPNPCTNGSFEELAPNGFPVDWGPVGTRVEVSDDAHSGRRSLRLLRTADTPSTETGLNRGGRPGAGPCGALIDRLRGGVDFYYKAVSAEGAKLNVYVIPMTADLVEKTGSPRATYTVPDAHVGDGRWHHARLKYDFTDNPEVKCVHFAARIVGTAGELLLDDLAYVERVGVNLRFGTVRLFEDPDRPGERCVLQAHVENAGDVPTGPIVATLKPPAGLRVDSAELRLGPLAPDAKAKARWTVEGRRTGPCSLAFTAVAGESTAETTFDVGPELNLRSFGPTAPVAMQGRAVPLECVVENTGTAILLKPTAEFRLPSKTVTRSVEEVAPGRSVVLSAAYVPPQQTPAVEVAVAVAGQNVEDTATARSSLVVGAATDLPAPSGRLAAASSDEHAVLENRHVRLAFRCNAFGFGPGEIAVATASGWQTVAWLPRLSRVVLEGAEGKRHESVVLAKHPPKAEVSDPARLRFAWTAQDPEGATCRVNVDFELADDAKTIATSHELTCDRARKLLAFDGPMLYVLDRDVAVLPGLEWLIDGEVSSGALDIVEGHPHQVRYVVHPDMVTIPAAGIASQRGTVGLLWDVHQKWDGRSDRPSLAFASPDRFANQRAHLAGLFLPTVPDYVEANAREAATPYPLEAGKPLRLTATLYADGWSADPLAPIDAWADRHGWPEPAPLPRGSYEAEIEFSMQGYLDALWVPETKEWWTTKGNALLSRKGRPRLFVVDLLLGEILSPSATVRRACRARAEEVLAILGGEPRIGDQRYPTRADLAMANPAAAAGLLAARDESGAWRFDADHVGTGPFEGADYYDLGPDEAVELGTCARKAFEVLRYARIAGDAQAYEQMRNTLELMETFRVPRAAQVWEVPVHTPDVLAAADAVDAYVEAYRFGADERWLRNAIEWGRRGLPFIYLWDDPEKPFLLGGSIPVFGATWYRGSWFGRPVQWNGLRYANALLKLDEHDKSYPWRQIAETIVRSAIHQQDADGENVALWPDYIDAIDGTKCPWVFAPRQILRNVLKLTGRDEDPATVILGQGQERLHVTAVAKITEADWDGRKLTFRATYPRGEQGVVLVSNVARPVAVALDGRSIAERDQVEQGPEAGWWYDESLAYLSIRIPSEGTSSVSVDGAAFRRVDRLPRLAVAIAFEFDDSPQGWVPAHHVASVSVREGVLVGTVTGPDPYLVRPLMRVEGDANPVVRIRMRVTAGHGGQFFWTTESSPSFAEDKTVRFAIQPDGRFHEYRLEPGNDRMWAGQTITAIRIDPGNGATSGEFAIDYVRGEGRDRMPSGATR